MPQWGSIVRLFMLSVNPMSGVIQHLPCEGAMLDQPVKTMSLWGLLQSLWSECMPKDPVRSLSSGG